MSLIFYNAALAFYALLIRIAALFHPKAKLFLAGRKQVFRKIKDALDKEHRPVIWMHCASLGEFEQGRPVMEALKSKYPGYAIFLTFFSPSGYEIKKKYPVADYVFYLPLDSHRNAIRLVGLLKPVLVLFVKYEFWFHYLKALNQYRIPVVLFSAYFQKDQPFFKWYGGIYRKMLGFYQQIFVQDETSRALLNGVGIPGVQITGDTRFDRAVKIVSEPQVFPNVAAFKGDKKLIIAGSSWPEDEALLARAVEHLSDFKLLIVPHETDSQNCSRILDSFAPDICFWNADNDLLAGKKMAIVNEVGKLAFLYRYADLVWIGGGFGKGIHNIIEPAVYGLPVFFGPRYQRFREARELLKEHAVCSVDTSSAFVLAMQDEKELERMSLKAKSYVRDHLGATVKIMNYLEAKCFSTTS